MKAYELYTFKEQLNKDGILFCYSGVITEKILTGIAAALKSKLAVDETDRKVARGVFSILVEQVQNVIRYSAEVDPPDDELSELRYGILLVGCKDGQYHITCGNLVRRNDAAVLQKNLNEIREMNKDELKAKYKKVLKGDIPDGSKGAGVGFIDIARRAQRGFEFDFHDVSAEHLYFSIIAYV